MNWVGALARTYDLVPPDQIGRIQGQGEDAESTALMPVCHTTNLAHIEITLNGKGELRHAAVLNPAEPTLIPCTEESGGRAGSKPRSHPLSDKLQYLAGDFAEFGGTVTSGFSANPTEPFNGYLADLEAWCRSSYAHPKVAAILAYVRKGSLIRDLVTAKVLHVDADGHLLSIWPTDLRDAPPIFRVLKGASEPADAFVRWRVQIGSEPEDRCWEDSSLWKSWIGYYVENAGGSGFCYATGTERLLAKQHPAKIRNSGDKAKLISSNDGSGFTYRGRFVEADEACGVGLDVTQKAHNALRWLFAKQGDWKSGLVAWALSREVLDVPPATMGAEDYAWEDPESKVDSYDAGEYAARQFRKRMAGYSGDLLDSNDLFIMGLDAATPGRMSITVFRELKSTEYLERLSAWHGLAEDKGTMGCRWRIDYGYDKKAKKRCIYLGAPSPRDIVFACYGSRADEKLARSTIERILSCILDQTRLPYDLVDSAIHRALKRSGMEPWEWKKTLGIACALYRKHAYETDKSRRYEVSLEEERSTRDYLYGRLLALAEHVERQALRASREGERETNAERYMVRFSERPCETWKTIELKLRPYFARMGVKFVAYRRLMDSIIELFAPGDFIVAHQLGGEFLLGYHNQRYWLEDRKSVKGQFVLKESVEATVAADDEVDVEE